MVSVLRTLADREMSSDEAGGIDLMTVKDILRQLTITCIGLQHIKSITDAHRLFNTMTESFYAATVLTCIAHSVDRE